jgi:hypothetical protein
LKWKLSDEFIEESRSKGYRDAAGLIRSDASIKEGEKRRKMQGILGKVSIGLKLIALRNVNIFKGHKTIGKNSNDIKRLGERTIKTTANVRVKVLLAIEKNYLLNVQ